MSRLIGLVLIVGAIPLAIWGGITLVYPHGYYFSGPDRIQGGIVCVVGAIGWFVIGRLLFRQQRAS